MAGLSIFAIAIGVGIAWSLWHEYRSPSLEEVVRWLPADTEAVACVDAPIALPDFENQNKGFISAIPNVPIVLFISSRQVDVDRLFKLPSCSVDRSIVGMRKFGWDAQKGLQTFEGASVLVFAPGNISAAKSFFDRLSQVAGMATTSTGNPQSGLLLERPRDTVIVVATSNAYAREVISRMKELIVKSPLAPVGREGLSRSAGSREWAYRAFDRGVVAGDPFSPRCPDPRGGDALDPEAKSILVRSPPGDQSALDVEYSSGTPDVLKRLQDRWRVFRSGAPPTVGSSRPGTILLHFPKSPAEQNLTDSLLFYFARGAPE